MAALRAWEVFSPRSIVTRAKAPQRELHSIATMTSGIKELLVSCGESIIQRRYYMTPDPLSTADPDAFYSKPADGLRSLEDVRAVAFSAMCDLAFDVPSFRLSNCKQPSNALWGQSFR